MRVFISICLVLLVVSISSAATYKWEDANGMHFTDNILSVPMKYRDKAIAEDSEDISPSNSQGVKRSATSRPVLPLKTIRDNLTPRMGSGAIPYPSQVHLRPFSANAKTPVPIEKAFNSVIGTLAKFVVIGFCLFFVWLLMLVDIIRSEFTNPSNKIVWILLFLFLAPFGILLYPMLASGQKVKRIPHGNDDFQTRRMDPPPSKRSRDGEFEI